MKKVDNICFIADDYPSKDRMVFVFVQQLVEAIVDKGVSVNVVAPQSITRALFRGVKLLPQKELYRCERGEYYVYRPYSVTFGNNNKSLYKLAKSFNRKRFETCLKRINPSIVYGHFWHNAIKAKPYAEKYGKPLFVACGEGDDALERLVSGLSPESIARIKEKIAGVISVSTENKRKCLEFGLCDDNNVAVLPNCVNTKFFHPIDASYFRESLGAEKDDFVISFTGAFIDRKGYNRLSEAVERIDDSRIKVIFCGAPMPGCNNFPTCKGIIHCGAVNHDDLPKYLCASDVFVLPTLKEGCCNAIVEALACGVPVISSNRPFNKDILNAKNSVLIDPENVNDISIAIKKLMDNKEKYNTLKEQAMVNSDFYSISVRAEKILTFINSKLNS